MGNKLLVLMLTGAAATSFVGSFIASSRLQARKQQAQTAAMTTAEQAPGGGMEEGAQVVVPRSLRDEQVDMLARQLRDQMAQYEEREGDLEKREEMAAAVRRQMDDDTKHLNELLARVTKALTKLKEERTQVEKEQLLMSKLEQTNLGRLASYYDKMDAASASRILSAMYMGEEGETAIKILYLMSERTAAKVLQEVGDAEVAAAMTTDFKHVKQGE